MKIYTSTFPVDWMTVYLGGQYYLPGDPAFKADVPWTNKKVRQALNMAVNRKEVNQSIFAGKGTPTYVTGWSDKSEGFNPEWASRFDKMYGFNPARRRSSWEAGYGPGSRWFKTSLHRTRVSRKGPSSPGPRHLPGDRDRDRDRGPDWAKVREMFRRR